MICLKELDDIPEYVLLVGEIVVALGLDHLESVVVGVEVLQCFVLLYGIKEGLPVLERHQGVLFAMDDEDGEIVELLLDGLVFLLRQLRLRDSLQVIEPLFVHQLIGKRYVLILDDVAERGKGGHQHCGAWAVCAHDEADGACAERNSHRNDVLLCVVQVLDQVPVHKARVLLNLLKGRVAVAVGPIPAVLHYQHIDLQHPGKPLHDFVAAEDVLAIGVEVQQHVVRGLVVVFQVDRVSELNIEARHEDLAVRVHVH